MNIRFNNVRFRYRNRPLLFDGLSCDIIPSDGWSGGGFITAIMGASGAGKSTILKLILEEMLPESGHIVIDPPGGRVSYLSQEPILFEHLSTVENARYFSRLRETRASFDEDTYQFAARELRLEGILQRNASVLELSGGERQRIALLRALSIRPALLLLDEPCRGLDVPVRQEFLFYLRQFADLLKLGAVYVTHQQAEARLIADHVVFLVRDNGSNLAIPVSGSVKDLTTIPQHEIVALTFSESPMNRLFGAINGTTITINNVPFVAPEDLSIDATLPVSVLFSAAQVTWSEAGGIPCKGLRTTGQYYLAGCSDSGNESVVAGPAVSGTPRQFTISGDVLLYNQKGRLLARAKLRPLAK